MEDEGARSAVEHVQAMLSSNKEYLKGVRILQALLSQEPRGIDAGVAFALLDAVHVRVGVKMKERCIALVRSLFESCADDPFFDAVQREVISEWGIHAGETMQKRAAKVKKRSKKAGGDPEQGDIAAGASPSGPTVASTSSGSVDKDAKAARKERLDAMFKDHDDQAQAEDPDLDDDTLRRHPLRELGGQAMSSDVTAATFLFSNKFHIGEIVLVMRSRGGFNYGEVKARVSLPHCFFRASEDHRHILWRVVYPSAVGRQELFKDLPSPYVGKLIPIPPPMEGTTATTTEPKVGDRPSDEDVQLLTLSGKNSFVKGEWVAVPRSGGGFTLGCVWGEHDFTCRAGSDAHSVSGWRVIVAYEDGTGKEVKKDLLTGLIGKLMSAWAQEHRRSLAAGNVDTPDGGGGGGGVLATSPPLADAGRSLPASDPKLAASINSSSSSGGSGGGASAAEVPGVLRVEKGSTSRSGGGGGGRTKRSGGKKRGDAVDAFSKCIVVIDGPNVAMRHGRKKAISVAGIKIVLDHYTSRGHTALAFVPDYYLTRKPPPRGTGATLGDFLPMADDIPLLNALIESGQVVTTPSQDYDDSYCIQYAKRKKGVIVTNDRYNDYITKQPDEQSQARSRRWIRKHCISFTFVGSDFMPNPDFVWPHSSKG